MKITLVRHAQTEENFKGNMQGKRNILLNDMAAFKDVMAAESTLILSGFYENDAPLLLKEANRLGLYEVEKQTEEDWCRLTLKAL